VCVACDNYLETISSAERPVDLRFQRHREESTSKDGGGGGGNAVLVMAAKNKTKKNKKKKEKKKKRDRKREKQNLKDSNNPASVPAAASSSSSSSVFVPDLNRFVKVKEGRRVYGLTTGENNNIYSMAIRLQCLTFMFTCVSCIPWHHFHLLHIAPTQSHPQPHPQTRTTVNRFGSTERSRW
jgi:hypothetical protein